MIPFHRRLKSFHALHISTPTSKNHCSFFFSTRSPHRFCPELNRLVFREIFIDVKSYVNTQREEMRGGGGRGGSGNRSSDQVKKNLKSRAKGGSEKQFISIEKGGRKILYIHNGSSVNTGSRRGRRANQTPENLGLDCCSRRRRRDQRRRRESAFRDQRRERAHLVRDLTL